MTLKKLISYKKNGRKLERKKKEFSKNSLKRKRRRKKNEVGK